MMVHICNTSEDTKFKVNLGYRNFEDRLAIGPYLKNKTEKQTKKTPSIL